MSEESNEPADPLKNADVGETVTLRKSKTLHTINYTPEEYFGSDRFAGNIEIVDIEIVEGDYDDKDIRVTWESDVTKRLPRRWDYHAEPVTEEEHRQARRQKWMRRAGKAAAVFVPAGIATALSVELTGRIAEQMTINGEPMAAPSPAATVGVVGVIMLLALVIHYGLSGGFPGTVRGAR